MKRTTLLLMLLAATAGASAAEGKWAEGKWVIVKDREGVQAALKQYKEANLPAPPEVDHELHTDWVGVLFDLLVPEFQFGSWGAAPSLCGGRRCTNHGYPDASLQQLRSAYGDIPESELWNICTGKHGSFLVGLSRQGACAMVSNPDPLRPVEVPHRLENDWRPRAQDADFLLEVPNSTHELQRDGDTMNIELEVAPQPSSQARGLDDIPTESAVLKLDPPR